MNQIRNYIDIHTHILPGIDDGSSCMAETMEMIRIAYDEGIRVIIATPHYGKWNPDYDKDEALKKLSLVREQVEKRYKDMKIYLGNELYYTPGIIEDLRQGKALPLGGTDYVLVEFGVKQEYEQLYDAVRLLVTEGYRPVLAHIERYQCLRGQLACVEELISLGAYMQVNARSFLGGRFDKRTAWCSKLLSNDLIHFIASDCHDSEVRTPIMDTAVKKMLEKTDEQTIDRIIRTNLIKLIKNKFI